LPGLTEAVEQGDWQRANQQAHILQAAVDRNTKLIDEITAELLKASANGEGAH